MQEEISKGKNLSQAGVFPLRLQDDDLRWKLSLDYKVPYDTFLLFIDGLAFMNMPLRAVVAPSGAQNIEHGFIKLNEVGVRVYKDYTPLNNDTVFWWLSEHKLQLITEIDLESLRCSS